MQSNSLRATALLFLSLGALTSAPTCQAPSATASADAPAPKPDNVPGLPGFLLKVPGGNVLMGMEVDEFVKAASQVAFVFNPDQAFKVAPKKLKDAMRRSSSVLGRKSVPVETFFLGKWPVKNSEFKVYVDRLRAAQANVRPPYHWWRYGCEKNYNTHLNQIRKAFPKDPKGAILYWEREGDALPYKLQDEKGNSIADHPVVYVSWRDANAFAASIGMRLPTEAELTRAMRGDGKHTWPGGEQGEDKDKYTQQLLEALQMSRTSDYHTKVVGTVKGSIGPYGHVDLFGHVWQLIGDLGFGPIHDVPTYVKEWGKLQKHKIGRLCEKKAVFGGSKVIAKGGSYLSYGGPIQLMIDTRAPMKTTDVFESMGMRLAKSLAPGYDYLYSLQRIKFDSNGFAKKGQGLDLKALVGGERYELSPNGFPSDYEAVALAPANWLLNGKSAQIKKLLEATQTKPIAIGALATTAKLVNGTGPGLYTVFYRNGGIPRELRDAIKAGHREIVKERKAAAKKKKKDGKEEAKKKDKKQDKVRKWRMVAKKYGLNDDDLAEAKASTGDCGFVRIDGIEISTDRDMFILATEGKMISVLRGTKREPTKSNKPIEHTFAIEAGTEANKDKALAKFRFGIPLLERKRETVVVFELEAVLDQAPPTSDKPWRLPITTETGAGQAKDKKN